MKRQLADATLKISELMTNYIICKSKSLLFFLKRRIVEREAIEEGQSKGSTF